MKTWYYFFVAAVAATFLSGCGSSSSSPSKDDVENAVRSYVGMARTDIGDVKVDSFKILSESVKKMGDDNVFFRQFEAVYTVTSRDNPSKHSFAGTIALVKQGQKWIAKKDASTLTYVYSPPTIDAATQAALDQQPKVREEPVNEQRNK
jgi:hypothetical protein